MVEVGTYGWDQGWLLVRGATIEFLESKPCCCCCDCRLQGSYQQVGGWIGWFFCPLNSLTFCRTRCSH